jgi:DNA-binding response OmpR family regulator
MKLMIVEDEDTLSESLREYLEQEGHICEVTATFDKAYQKLHIYEYDCVLVDITLPGGSGLDLIEELKKEYPETGIIIISARDALDDRITGLELGADDYLTKPFHLSELNARINALIRRKQYHGNRHFEKGNLTIYPGKKEIHAGNHVLDLTAKEYDLLNYFITNANRVLTKEAIAEHIWGDHYDMVDSFDFIYVHIRNLRKKLKEASGEDPIKTIYGMGYKFEVS